MMAMQRAMGLGRAGVLVLVSVGSVWMPAQISFTPRGGELGLGQRAVVWHTQNVAVYTPCRHVG